MKTAAMVVGIIAGVFSLLYVGLFGGLTPERRQTIAREQLSISKFLNA